MATEPLKKDDELKEALTVMFGEGGAEGIVETKPEPKKDPETPTPPAIAEPPAPAKQPVAPAKVAKPKAAPRRKPPEPPAVNLEERDRIVAAAAVTGAAEAAKQRGKDPVSEIPPKDDLDDGQRDTIAAMEYLGKKDAKYATLAERTMSFWKKEEEYVAKWQKDHPDETFDPKSDDHAEFYEKHEPQYEDADLAKARKARETEALEARVDDKVNQRLSQKEQLDAEKKRQSDESNDVQAEADNAQVALIETLVPEAKKFFNVDGKTKLTDAEWQAFAEEDPAAAKVLKREASYLARRMTELERLNRYPKTYLPDFQNDIHRSLAQTTLNAEDKILELPPKEQLHQGKQFITQSDWGAKVHAVISDKKTTDAEKRAALNDLHSRHWMLQPGHVKNLIIAEHRKRAAEKLAEFREVEEGFKKRATKTATEGSPAPTATETTPAPAKAVATPAKKAAREVEPTIPGGGDIMPTTDKGSSNGESALETLTKIGI